MPTNPQQVETKVDHAQRSREWLEQAESRGVNEREVPAADRDLRCAAVHASLAVAEEIRQFRELMGRSYS